MTGGGAWSAALPAKELWQPSEATGGKLRTASGGSTALPMPEFVPVMVTLAGERGHICRFKPV